MISYPFSEQLINTNLDSDDYSSPLKLNANNDIVISSMSNQVKTMNLKVKKTDVTDNNSAFFFIPSQSYSYFSTSGITVDSSAVPIDDPNLSMYFLISFYAYW